MSRNLRWVSFLVVAVAVAAAAQVWAFPEVARKTKLACGSCHTNIAGGTELNDGGKAYKADATKLPAKAEKSADYVGSKKCRMCHLKEYKAWEGTAHAGAYATLMKSDAKAAGEIATKLKVELKGSAAATDGCVKCHAVGVGLTGGFVASDTTKVATHGGVGCETCHGPGSVHVSAPKDQKKGLIAAGVSETYCKHCHTAEMSPNFKYEDYKKKGIHTVASE